MASIKHNKPVHIGRGGGYAWQWLLAADVVLHQVVLGQNSGVGVLDRAIESIGPITSVAVEGEVVDGGISPLQATNVRLEDITITGVNGRLHIQAKAKQNDNGYWTDGDDEIKSLRARARKDGQGIYLFASNASVARLKEDGNVNWAQSNVAAFQHSRLPRNADDGAISGEVADAISRIFGRLGAAEPQRAMNEWVMVFIVSSIADGGYEFSLSELRGKIEALASPPVVPPIAAGFRLFEDALERVSWPTYADLESREFLPRPEVAQAQALAREHKVVVIKGPADQGKSVIALLIGFEAMRGGAVVAYYDALRDGMSERGMFGVFAAVRTHALLRQREAWVILDNPHVSPDLTDEAFDAWEQSDRAITLVLATRAVRLRNGRDPSNVLDRASIDVSLLPLNDGRALARFWIRREHGLDGDELEVAAHVISVPAFTQKGHLLREAIRAYDPVKKITSRSAIMEHLWTRHLSDLAVSNVAALEILYVVAGLFRSEVRTDPSACRSLLNRGDVEFKDGLDTLLARGVIRQSECDGYLSLFHETLARLYWILLASRVETLGGLQRQLERRELERSRTREDIS